MSDKQEVVVQEEKKEEEIAVSLPDNSVAVVLMPTGGTGFRAMIFTRLKPEFLHLYVMCRGFMEMLMENQSPFLMSGHMALAQDFVPTEQEETTTNDKPPEGDTVA